MDLNKKAKIGIVNYGSGNIFSISNIYKKGNIDFFISSEPKELVKASHLILPGVGAFDETMKTLNDSGLKVFLDEMVLGEKKPILGICVGMQLLAENSEEGNLQGFGWIKGKVRKFDESVFKQKPYLPHLGWNTVNIKQEHTILNQVDPEEGFYFLHSYYFDCQNTQDILSTTDYGISFASAVHHENVYGMQFHPEKSHQNGINIFYNFSQV
ncbi:imidazole glycerol phosphate synthase subunit HisH [Aquirufa aurantiipilula]|uniref:imidazole glycerol phosphate synthase subunit HisH n=1 Tax=Aquirufa aurantiipilula TaxID=2696561 RepID=UPI001CAA455B|nr:imidazole glycerol phosphate synthase subunit HisH [Aquirufa aurantiipilula]MBZ1326568.1 imidazole glycerol phosphate synthase subunit HisH [Aquirufa aurantiipilula]